MSNDQRTAQNASTADIISGNYNTDGNPLDYGPENASTFDIMIGAYNKRDPIAGIERPQISTTQQIVEGDHER